jgi:two-component system CheB/CheR fusion protein
VRLAKDGMLVGPNQIFVIPPDAILTIKAGRLHLSCPASPAARRVSVNTFLSSLAEDQGENAVGIILSGFGTDGALGIAAIKEHGGLTLSQAEFDHHAKRGMPQSATSGGFVDHVLAVEDMPQALLDYRHHRAIYDAHKGPDGIRQARQARVRGHGASSPLPSGWFHNDPPRSNETGSVGRSQFQ